MDIREYLCREAAKVTEGALRSIRSAQDWRRERPGRLARFHSDLGLLPLLQAPRTPLNIRSTGTLERDGYRIEKLYFESLPRLYVTGNLYLPEPRSGPAPALIYFCGHGPLQKADPSFQAHLRRCARLGFVTLVVETIQLGEIKGEHHGCFSKGRFHWYSLGYSPAAVECWNGIRALDLLCERPEVDAARIGVTGISGGGSTSWWVGAADERARVVAPVCCTGTLRGHLEDRTLDGHCDCVFPINHARWDLADIGALLAPRPLLIAAAERDVIFNLCAAREVHAGIARIYGFLGAEDRCRILPTPGPHSYHALSRTHLFSWFLKHLAGKDIPPEEVGDVGEEPGEEPAALRVYGAQVPSDERVTTIDEDFIPRARPRPLATRAEWESRRKEVVRRLNETAFAHFPKEDPPLDLEVHQRFEDNRSTGSRFRFISEEGVRVPGKLVRSKETRQLEGVLVVLRGPGELCRMEGTSEQLFKGFEQKWVQAFVETRGVGALSWGPELAWHVRRATAVLGRTVASLRVYDTLRALQAVRELLPEESEKIGLAASGEMAAVALYAALLDGRVRQLVLHDPPATQNAGSTSDGRGPALEMLCCLTVTDLPEVAALLWPAELIFIRQRPETYRLTEESYRNLGPEGSVRRVTAAKDWRNP